MASANEVDRNASEFEQSLLVTCDETLASAGEEVLALIRAGQRARQEELSALKRLVQEQEARERQQTETHWHGLKKAVQLLIDRPLLPFCNVNQFDPGTVAGGFTWMARDFQVVISVPGCTDVAGLFHATASEELASPPTWHKEKFFLRYSNERYHWRTSSYLICGNNEEGPHFQVAEGNYRYHDDLAQALALAVEEYREQNRLQARCLQMNVEREKGIMEKKRMAAQASALKAAEAKETTSLLLSGPASSLLVKLIREMVREELKASREGAK